MSEFPLYAIGQTVQLTSQVWDQNNRPINDAQVAWSSSDARIATVTAQGLVTAVMNGHVKVTARSGNATASVDVWVSQVMARFVVEPSPVTLSAVGETVQLKAVIEDSNGHALRDASVSWTSYETDIVTVDENGLVTAVGNGETKIVARYLRVDVETQVTVSVRSPDRDVLVLLYNQTNGENWNRSENWLSEKPVREWSDVTLDGRGNVKALWLRSNNLKGQIPAELGQLSQLEELNLSDNELEGPIPPELGNLSKIEHLALHENQLTGNIPQEIGELSELRALFLGDNRLTGAIPKELGLLAKVEEVFLDNNRLTGSIPAELGRLNNLIKLVLSFNQLSGSLPPELGELRQLEGLFLEDNPELSGPIPRSFLNLRNVRLYARNTALCAPQDPEFYDWLLEIQSLDRVATCEYTDTDREILVTLYNEMDGENWTESQHWLSDRPIGEWFGIETDSNGQVRSISLPGNMISGELPYELGEFTELEMLDLSSNLLTGPLPPTLGQLENLVSLQLQDNIGLTGYLPESITALDNLERLLMHRTQVCAQRSSDIQAWLGGIPERRITDCDDLRFERIALDALYKRTLGSNWTVNEGWGSSEYAGSWFGITTNEDGFVTVLNLAENNLQGRLPQEIHLLGHLTHLDLTDNPDLGGPLPMELTRLSLDTLLLAGTQLCFSEDDEFQHWLSTIENASYETCGVVNPHPDLDALTAFYNATNGPHWDNKNNWLSHSPVETWFGLVTNEEGRVTEINMFANDLEGEIPPEIGELSQLKRIYLERNSLTGSIPPQIGKLKNLETLILMYNDISGTLPPEIGQLGSLKTLLLQDNELTGTIPPEIGRLSNLNTLMLNDNDLEGNIPDEIGQLKNLNVLFLGTNGLSGPIPEEIGQLENLTLLDLSEGLLTGSIPVELYRLRKLETLRLALNRLSGSVSSEIARLASLEEFDVRLNTEMSGRLPQEIKSLNLTHLLTRGTSICTPVDAEFQVWLQGISLKELAEPCDI
ncbi:MAG: Ig-like domain-containing protein [Gemmatimonadetes bacterium]|nr:Ig-like domain-containing protein [Gemmatimonadota bacterium]MDE2678585.1 Ig-like domain-containing protein [Gemmatimonadota bacterium]